MDKSVERPRHYLGLDGIRGLAILMVVFSHFIIVAGDMDSSHPLQRLLMSGHLGVDLFFVLSGFLITGILIDGKKSTNYFSAFYARRALRIFPLYYGVLLFGWLSVVSLTPKDIPRLSGADSYAWHWFYASNIGISFKGDWLNSPTWVQISHFWSLAIEEQFYLFWPVLVFILPPKWLERLSIFLVVSSPLVLPILYHQIGDTATYVSTLGRLGELTAGAWLSIMIRKPQAWANLSRYFGIIALVTGLALLLERSFFPVLKPIEQTAMMILSAACVGIATDPARRVTQIFFQSSVLRWLGSYSYGIYVYHHVFKNVWRQFLWNGWILPMVGPGGIGKMLYFTSAGGITLGLAWLSWRYFEAPILSLKSRFNYRFKG